MRHSRWLTREDCLIGAAAVASVLLYVAVASRDGLGFPLDDSWIHQTYARNLARHGEWAFYPGQPSTASTSPLYTLLLAIGYLLRLPHLAWTYTLGALTLAAAGWVNARLAPRLFPHVPNVGLWTGLMTVCAWHLIWAAASGMETMLFALLVLVVIGLVWREQDALRAAASGARPAFWRGLLLGAAGAALTLTRPEGLALVGLAGIAGSVAHLEQGDRRTLRWLAWGLGAVLGWVAGVAPYAVWNYAVSGDILPSTASAKQAEYAATLALPLARRIWMMLKPLTAGGQIVLLPGLLAVLLVPVRRSRLLAAPMFWFPAIWAIGHVALYALRLPAPYQHGRYVQPVLPVVILYGVGGTLWLVQQAKTRFLTRVLSRSLALTAVAVTLGFVIIGARAYASDVQIINSEMVAAAQWVERHLPPSELLAAHDIGALGYFAPRPILDLAGLLTPEVVPIIRDHEALMKLMCARSARYLMVMPDQRPAPAGDPRLGGPPIFETGAPYAPAAGGGNMAVYALDWTGGCSAK